MMGKTKEKPQPAQKKYVIHKYSVVQFDEDEGFQRFKLFECIPDLWFVNELRNSCFFPPRTGKAYIQRAINCDKPEDDWGIFECVVVAEGFLTYNAGFKKVQIKLTEYNTSSAEEEQLAANFRRKHPGLVGESFEDVFVKPLSTVNGNVNEFGKKSAKVTHQPNKSDVASTSNVVIFDESADTGIAKVVNSKKTKTNENDCNSSSNTEPSIQYIRSPLKTQSKSKSESTETSKIGSLLGSEKAAILRSPSNHSSRSSRCHSIPLSPHQSPSHRSRSSRSRSNSAQSSYKSRARNIRSESYQSRSSRRKSSQSRGSVQSSRRSHTRSNRSRSSQLRSSRQKSSQSRGSSVQSSRKSRARNIRSESYQSRSSRRKSSQSRGSLVQSSRRSHTRSNRSRSRQSRSKHRSLNRSNSAQSSRKIRSRYQRRRTSRESHTRLSPTSRRSRSCDTSSTRLNGKGLSSSTAKQVNQIVVNRGSNTLVNKNRSSSRNRPQHERSNNLERKMEENSRRINEKGLSSSAAKVKQIVVNRGNSTLVSSKSSTSPKIRSSLNYPQSTLTSQHSLRHSRFTSRSRSRSPQNFSVKDLVKTVKKLTDVVKVNNERAAQNDRRLHRLEVTINKIFITIGDMNGNNRMNDETENDSGFIFPDLPIDSKTMLYKVHRKLQDKEFRKFWLNQEKNFCCPTKTSTDTVNITKYLKRFITLNVRCQLTLKETGDSGLTLYADYNRVYLFLIDVMADGYRSCNKKITFDDVHTALRIVWGRSKQLQKDQKNKK